MVTRLKAAVGALTLAIAVGACGKQPHNQPATPASAVRSSAASESDLKAVHDRVCPQVAKLAIPSTACASDRSSMTVTVFYSEANSPDAPPLELARLAEQEGVVRLVPTKGQIRD